MDDGLSQHLPKRTCDKSQLFAPLNHNCCVAGDYKIGNFGHTWSSPVEAIYLFPFSVAAWQLLATLVLDGAVVVGVSFAPTHQTLIPPSGCLPLCSLGEFLLELCHVLLKPSWLCSAHRYGHWIWGENNCAVHHVRSLLPPRPPTPGPDLPPPPGDAILKAEQFTTS